MAPSGPRRSISRSPPRKPSGCRVRVIAQVRPLGTRAPEVAALDEKRRFAWKRLVEIASLLARVGATSLCPQYVSPPHA